MSERGLTLYESGLGALEMFLTARLFMYQQVYFHRTVRAIDLDLAEVFAPSIRAMFGDGSPADRLAAFADLDEYALLHQAARWARGEDVSAAAAGGGGADAAGDAGRGVVTPAIADAWRAILLRRPRWHLGTEIRAELRAGRLSRGRRGRARHRRATARSRSTSRSSTPGRPAGPRRTMHSALEARDGVSRIRLSEALSRLPAFALIGRRYART